MQCVSSRRTNQEINQYPERKAMYSVPSNLLGSTKIYGVCTGALGIRRHIT